MKNCRVAVVFAIILALAANTAFADNTEYKTASSFARITTNMMGYNFIAKKIIANKFAPRGYWEPQAVYNDKKKIKETIHLMKFYIDFICSLSHEEEIPSVRGRTIVSFPLSLHHLIARWNPSWIWSGPVTKTSKSASLTMSSTPS